MLKLISSDLHSYDYENDCKISHLEGLVGSKFLLLRYIHVRKMPGD